MLFNVKFYWWLYVYCTFASIFSMYIYIQNQYEYSKLWVLKDSDNTLNKEYDFIVVGAGSAGSLLAGRLAVSHDYKVLLIEAGGEPSRLLDIPFVTPLLQRSSYDWQYQTVPQFNSCLGLKDQIVSWPMGKVFGGTSRLNYMIYLRGHETDFVNWSEGFHWSRDDVLHYFKKSEHHLGEFKDDVTHHGRDGPLFISDQVYFTRLGDAMISGLSELNVPKVDLNDLTSTGAMKTQHTSHRGRRWSSQDALLRGLGVTARLTISSNTRVNRVLLKDDFQAYGVEFEDGFGRRGQVTARHGVILSAGVIGSAKILLHSGIGPKEHLSSLNIKVVADLPVGENLQDHLTTGIDLILLNETIYPIFQDINPLNYLFSGEGLLGHTFCEATAVIKRFVNGDDQPVLQLMALPAGASSDFGTTLKDNLRISDKLWNEYFVKLSGRRQAVSIMPVVLHPRSKGTVRLASLDPSIPPLIDPKYLSDPHDVEVLILGIRAIELLLLTEGMRQLGAEFNDQPLPGCEDFTFNSYLYWECYVRHLTLSSYHPVGTCSMGSDPLTSVVDHQLRVHGIQGLYVVDGSVMPTLPSANIQAAVFMIAEKAADLIKEHYYTRLGTCPNSFRTFLSLLFVGDVCTTA